MTVAIGTMYEIPDGDHTYYAVMAAGQDFFFIDGYDNVDKLDKPFRYFLRLPVSLPSIRRAKWKKIGIIDSDKRILEYGKYLNQPFGSNDTFLINNKDGSFVKITDINCNEYETAAVWDAVSHIIPIIRYHFFQLETPFSSMVKFAERKNKLGIY